MRKRSSGPDKLTQEKKQQVSHGLSEVLQHIKEVEGEDFIPFALEFESRTAVPPPKPPDVDVANNPFGVVDIITFAEHPYFLGLNLFPWQKLALKGFYSGLYGNMHLKIEDERPAEETSCVGCVWAHNRKREEEMAETSAAGKKPKPFWLPPDNSPCLGCTRFPEKLREERFSHLQKTTPLQRRPKIAALYDRGVSDRFETEADLMADETPYFGTALDPTMAAKVREKWDRRCWYEEMVLVLGRRSGKSMIVAIIALYEAYCLLMIPNPQAEFSMANHDLIQILNVAVSMDQALTAIFSKIKQLTAQSPFMSAQVGHDLIGALYFLTQQDKKEARRRQEQGIGTPMHGSIVIKCGHSNSKSLVGGNIFCCIVDEMAALTGRNEETSTDYELYSQIKPAMATFAPFAKMISISNPAGPTGQLYKLYRASFTDDSIFMLQLPTWLANPSVEPSFFEQERVKDPASFPMQYAAVFSSATKDAFIPEAYVEAAFEKGAGKRRAEFGLPGVRYFAHLDPAYSSDYYSLVIGHAEPLSGEFDLTGKPIMKAIIDHIHLWKPKGKNHPVQVDEVDRYVMEISKRFPIAQFSYDHWNSIGSIQKLQRFGLNAVRKQFTTVYQDLIYTQLLDLFMSGRIEIYDFDTQVSQENGQLELVEDVIQARDQFLFLQRKYQNGRFKVEAASGHHDDIPDGVAVVCYEALADKSYSRAPRAVRARVHGLR
jgi:hypothetical protein